MIIYITSCIIAYLLGAIPNSYILVKIKTGKDIRQIGSGECGATNTVRAIGKKWGFVVLFLDMLKGLIPVLALWPIAVSINADAQMFSSSIADSEELFKTSIGVFAIIGHILPVYLKFKGGKGVATTVGVFLGLVPFTMLIAVIIVIATIVISGYVSLGSIVLGVLLPVILLIQHAHISYVIFSIVIGLIIIVKHKENIKRLLSKSESKFSIKKEK